MKITACPVCGSRKVATAGIRDGINPKEYFKLVCKQCGWTGLPLEFDSEEDYNYFLNELQIDNKQYEDAVFEDPAEKAPYQRYFIRAFWASFLLLLLFIIPGLVYILLTIGAGLTTDIAIFFAFISFFAYIYIFWKKELWNMIKR